MIMNKDTFVKLAVVMLLSIALTSCAEVKVVEDSAAFLVSAYCKAPETARRLHRMNVARIVAPNEIQINCN
jgi:hypothetical protein